MSVLDFTAFAEQRVRLIEEENRAAILGSVKDAAQILFGLTDVFTHHTGEIDTIEVEPQFMRQDFRRHSFSCPTGTSEEGTDAKPTATHGAKPPGLIHRGPMGHVHGDLSQQRLLRVREHQIVPHRRWLDAPGQALQLGAGLRAAGVPEPAPQGFAGSL